MMELARKMLRFIFNRDIRLVVLVESAFSLLPIHLSCCALLGFQLAAQIYVDLCLPTGCSISCKYFEKFSSFLEWVLKAKITHYPDDFLVVSFFFVILWHALRTEGPSTEMSFLGIKIDMVEMVLCLSLDEINDAFLVTKQVKLKNV